VIDGASPSGGPLDSHTVEREDTTRTRSVLLPPHRPQTRNRLPQRECLITLHAMRPELSRLATGPTASQIRLRSICDWRTEDAAETLRPQTRRARRCRPPGPRCSGMSSERPQPAPTSTSWHRTIFGARARDCVIWPAANSIRFSSSWATSRFKRRNTTWDTSRDCGVPSTIGSGSSQVLWCESLTRADAPIYPPLATSED
jgi:hypothetical protein